MTFGLATYPIKNDLLKLMNEKTKGVAVRFYIHSFRSRVNVKSGCQILHSLGDEKSGCQILHSRRERKGVNFPELQVRKVEENDVKT